MGRSGAFPFRSDIAKGGHVIGWVVEAPWLGPTFGGLGGEAGRCVQLVGGMGRGSGLAVWLGHVFLCLLRFDLFLLDSESRALTADLGLFWFSIACVAYF